MKGVPTNSMGGYKEKSGAMPGFSPNTVKPRCKITRFKRKFDLREENGVTNMNFSTEKKLDIRKTSI